MICHRGNGHRRHPCLRFVNHRLGHSTRLVLVDLRQRRRFINHVVLAASGIGDLFERRATGRPVRSNRTSRNLDLAFDELSEQFVGRRRRITVADNDHMFHRSVDLVKPDQHRLHRRIEIHHVAGIHTID